MTATLREQIARLIAPSRWRVMDSYLAEVRRKYAGEDAAYDPEAFKDKASLKIADDIMALLPSLPDGWVDFVQGVADARNGEGMFWTTPDRDQDQDVIDRMGDAAVAMLAARPTPPTEPLETER